MAVATMIVTALGVSGVYTPSPEVRAWFDANGGAVAVVIVGLIPIVQAWLTRQRVYAPASVQELLGK